MKTCKSICRYMMILCFVCISCTKNSSKLEDALKAGGITVANWKKYSATIRKMIKTV